MSNNQYNIDHSPGFGGSLPPIGAQTSSSIEKRIPEGIHPISQPPSSSAMRNEGDSQYNLGTQNASNNYTSGYMNQNPPSSQPSYNQSGIQGPQSSYSQDKYGMGVTSSAPQQPPISSGMMGSSSLNNNQPPIGQRNYQSYSQPGYSGAQPSSHGMGQNAGGMPSPAGMTPIGSMSQPPIQRVPSMGGVSNSQGEKTYEPSALNASTYSGRPNYVELWGISKISQQEFDKKVVNCKSYKQTEVFAAIQVKDEEDGLKIIHYLMKNGVDLTAKDALKQSGLYYASRDGKLKILNLLIESGCSVNDKDQYGQTPIYYASRENRLDIWERLLGHGADVNSEDMHNQTCLFYSAKQGNIDISAKLLENGANINHTDNKRQTPLHWAQKSRKIGMVDWLISNGASPIIRKNEK